MTDSVKEVVEGLRKLERCIYIAVSESVADDIARRVAKAADLITAQQSRIEGLEASLRKHMTGECTCPPCEGERKQHWPTCPRIAAERIEALEKAKQ